MPACRKAGISVLWLEYGLTQKDIEAMPPTIMRGFSMDTNFEGDRKAPAIEAEIGFEELDDGEKVDAGKALVRDQWNSKSYSDLEDLTQPDDMRV